MIKRTVKNITRLRQRYSQRIRERAGAAGWATAILIFLVLLAISLLPRAFGQPRSHGGNQSLHHGVRKPSQLQLLPYHVLPNLPASQLPPGILQRQRSAPSRRKDWSFETSASSGIATFRNLSFDNHAINQPGDRRWKLSGLQRSGCWHFGEPLLACV